MGIIPLLVIETVPLDPDQVGPGKDEVKLFMHAVREQIDCDCVVLCLREELL